MLHFLHRALIAILILPLLMVPQLGQSADAPALEDGKRKINLSGRQRMLSQRMAKAACFASMSIQTAGHLAEVRDAHALFDVTLLGLRHGDPDQGIDLETAPRILDELAGVEELWHSFGASIANAAQSEAGAKAQLAQIAELNLPVLRQMNRTVIEFERHYGSTGEMHPALALALNVSGRQRMLSQKASKEFCLILAGYNAPANREALSETVMLFETSLRALIDGSDAMGLPGAPTDEIALQLQKVSDLWAPLKVIFEATAAGLGPTEADIAAVVRDNSPLLTEMNRAVWMYDQL